MIRKKQVQHLDPRQIGLVENALYYANPPVTSQMVHEKLPPMQEYIRKLLYKDLTRISIEKVHTCTCTVRNSFLPLIMEILDRVTYHI